MGDACRNVHMPRNCWEAPERERAAGHVAMPRARLFPSPLTAETVRLALAELLSDGHRRSTEACLKHWKEWKLSDDHLVLSMLSLCGQSSVLRHAFKKTHRKQADQEEVASEDDMLFLMSLSLGFDESSHQPQRPSAQQPCEADQIDDCLEPCPRVSHSFSKMPPEELAHAPSSTASEGWWASRSGVEDAPAPVPQRAVVGGGGSLGAEAAVQGAAKKVRCMRDGAGVRREGFLD